MISRRIAAFVSASLAALAFFISSSFAQEALQPTDAEYNFEVLWQTFDRNYALFGAKRVDWAALYRVYRPMVTAETTDDELFEIMSNMLEHL
ncbi:MAG: hypothetical protein PVJ43_10890, partial [Gemmatimonadales bacterium]